MTNQQTANQAPNPLPPTLPAGTRTTGGCVALETWELRDGEYVGMTRWPYGFPEDQLGYAHHEQIDWSTYKPAQPEPGGAKPACSHARIDEGRMVCLDCGVDDMGRYTAEDTDEQWCERRILELFGHRVQVYRGSYDYEAKSPSGVSVAHWDRGRGLCIGAHSVIANRDDSLIRSEVANHWGWPLKSPAGVGSNVGTGQTAEATSLPRATEPTLAEATRYCAECRAPMKARPGREVCRYCDLRCGGHSDRPPHEAMRLREESARQRMALMDERERPRPSRWSRELERAHPWSNDDD